MASRRRSPISSRSRKKTGVKIKTETYDGTLAAIKDKIGASSSPFDIVDLSQGALDALCRDGLLEQIDSSALTSGPGGQSVSDDFLSGGITSCGIASVAWSTAIAFDRQAFTKAQPGKIADLLDIQRFPGKRALPNGPRYTLELALLADGVDPADIYTQLATPEGVDRAFKALDKIKAQILWWDKAEDSISMLMRRKASMAAGYSGRIFRAAVGARQRIDVMWDGQIYDLDLWAIPKAATNKDEAKRFIAFATEPAQMAAQAALIAYGPMRKSAIALVGKHPSLDIDMKTICRLRPTISAKPSALTRRGGTSMAGSLPPGSKRGAISRWSAMQRPHPRRESLPPRTRNPKRRRQSLRPPRKSPSKAMRRQRPPTKSPSQRTRSPRRRRRKPAPCLARRRSRPRSSDGKIVPWHRGLCCHLTATKRSGPAGLSRCSPVTGEQSPKHMPLRTRARARWPMHLTR